jgi:hypothetical protein
MTKEGGECIICNPDGGKDQLCKFHARDWKLGRQSSSCAEVIYRQNLRVFIVPKKRIVILNKGNPRRYYLRQEVSVQEEPIIYHGYDKRILDKIGTLI